MTKDKIPEAVRALIAEHIQSIEALEILLLLFRNQGRWWSAESVADELHASSHSVGACLEDLSSRTLLDARVADTVLFRYNPVSETLDATVTALDRAYAETPVPLASLIYGRDTQRIRGFAEAFRIGKRGENG